jgi:ABC-type transport system involved in multi-copper enzyme maturation permease subunit
MKAIIWITWLGWWRTPGRITPILWLVLLCVVGPSLTMTFSDDGYCTAFNGSTVCVVGCTAMFGLATGVISRDREVGTLATIFARPVSRSTYVLAKWIALATAVWAVSILSGIIALLVYLFTRPELIYWADIPGTLATFTILVLGMSATFILCSTFGAASSDLSFYLTAISLAGMVFLSCALPQNMTSLEHLPAILVQAYHAYRSFCLAVCEPLWFLLFPLVRFPMSPERILPVVFSFLSNVACTLALAIWLMNRREVGYGNNG